MNYFCKYVHRNEMMYCKNKFREKLKKNVSSNYIIIFCYISIYAMNQCGFCVIHITITFRFYKRNYILTLLKRRLYKIHCLISSIMVEPPKKNSNFKYL